MSEEHSYETHHNLDSIIHNNHDVIEKHCSNACKINKSDQICNPVHTCAGPMCQCLQIDKKDCDWLDLTLPLDRVKAGVMTQEVLDTAVCDRQGSCQVSGKTLVQIPSKLSANSHKKDTKETGSNSKTPPDLFSIEFSQNECAPKHLGPVEDGPVLFTKSVDMQDCQSKQKGKLNSPATNCNLSGKCDSGDPGAASTASLTPKSDNYSVIDTYQGSNKISHQKDQPALDRYDDSWSELYFADQDLYFEEIKNICDKNSDPGNLSDIYLVRNEHRKKNWPVWTYEEQAMTSNFTDGELKHIYDSVRKTSLPNYKMAKIPLPSNLNFAAWEKYFGYDSDITNFVKYGFPMGHVGICFDYDSEEDSNHSSAIKYPFAVSEYIDRETKEKALSGPYKCNPFNYSRVSPILTTSKSDSDKRRVVFDLSFPHEFSINSYIIL